MKKFSPWMAVGLMAFAVAAHADSLSFSTFVGSSAINTASGINSNATIAITYAGNKFVGSVYYDTQLYTTNLSGGNVTAFGSPLPAPETNGGVGEVVLGASLGQAGFANGNIFAGSQQDASIYQYSNSGGTPTLFATLPTGAGNVRQIFFDPGNTFGGNMLVSTNTGNIYEVNSGGNVSHLVSVGEDTEGMDIAPASWGALAGQLLVGSEGSGTLRAVSTGGIITVVGTPGQFRGAETVSAVPTNLDGSNPLEGFYVANYATDVQFAQANQFITQGLLGTVIVTDEDDPNTAYDIADIGGIITVTSFGFPANGIHQFEDGIFVSPQRIADTNPGPAPEPSSLVMLGTGLLGLCGVAKRKIWS